MTRGFKTFSPTIWPRLVTFRSEWLSFRAIVFQFDWDQGIIIVRQDSPIEYGRRLQVKDYL